MRANRLEAIAGQARELARALCWADVPCEEVKDDKSCVMREGGRPLTRQEKASDWAVRPFWAYDTNNLCNGCCCYWFAERAAQELEHAAYWARRIEADAARRAQETA